jgi:hypothetical protein
MNNSEFLKSNSEYLKMLGEVNNDRLSKSISVPNMGKKVKPRGESIGYEIGDRLGGYSLNQVVKIGDELEAIIDKDDSKEEHQTLFDHYMEGVELDEQYPMGEPSFLHKGFAILYDALLSMKRLINELIIKAR